MHPSANREAYLLLTTIVQRIGLRRSEFLALLAERGHMISDDAFTNWGRAGRTFPRDWVLLQAIIAIISDRQRLRPCSAAEALQLLALLDFPFAHLPQLAPLFPPHDLYTALLPYLPPSLSERSRMVG
jgi:hypothetical protein